MATLALALVGDAYFQAQARLSRYKTDMVIDLVYPLYRAKQEPLVKIVRGRALSALSMRLGRAQPSMNRKPKERLEKSVDRALREDAEWVAPAKEFLNYLIELSNEERCFPPFDLESIIDKLNRGGFLVVLEKRGQPLPFGLDQCSSEDLKRLANAFLPGILDDGGNLFHGKVYSRRLITTVKAVEFLENQSTFFTPRMIVSHRFPEDHPLHNEVSETLRQMLVYKSQNGNWEKEKIGGSVAYKAKDVFEACYDKSLSDFADCLCIRLAELYTTSTNKSSLPSCEFEKLFKELNRISHYIPNVGKQFIPSELSSKLESLSKDELQRLLYWFGHLRNQIESPDETLNTMQKNEIEEVDRKKGLMWRFRYLLTAATLILTLGFAPFTGDRARIIRETQGLKAAYEYILTFSFQSVLDYSKSGYIYLRRGDFENAETVVRDVLGSTNDPQILTDMYWLQSKIDSLAGDFDGALYNLKRSKENTSSKNRLRYLDCHMAKLLLSMDEVEQAGDLLLKIEMDPPSADKSLDFFLNLKYRYLFAVGDFHGALDAALARYNLDRSENWSDMAAYAASQLSRIHGTLGDQVSALSFAFEAQRLFLKNEDNNGYIYNLCNFVIIFRNLNQPIPPTIVEEIELEIKNTGDLELKKVFEDAFAGEVFQ